MTDPLPPTTRTDLQRRVDRRRLGRGRAAARWTRHARRVRPGLAGPVRAGGSAGSAAILGDRVVRIEHTGSTSVPGLAAKPIIDITMVVPDSSDEPAYVPDLEAAGYKLVIREPGWFEHRVFKGPDTNINLHVFSPGCQEIDRMVGFRDWLRTHDDDRELYERTKRELASQTWGYVQNYADAKTEVVEEIVARAGLPPRVD